MIYTIIAYKPESTEMSMGHVMGEYQSDMKHLSSTRLTEILDFVVDVEIDNHYMDNQEDGYEFTLIVDGVNRPVVMEQYREQSKEEVATKVAQIDAKNAAERLERVERLKKEKEQEDDWADRKKYEELRAKYE